jgi:carbamoyl-phosphate synthase large subunit
MKRLLLTAAGGGVSENLIRAIRVADDPYFIIGTSCDRYSLARSSADRNYLIPRADTGVAYVQAVRTVVERERVDLIIPCHDTEVATLSRYRDEVGARLFFPRHDMIEVFQDKLKLNQELATRGVPVAETQLFTNTSAVDRLFERSGDEGLLWCRLRRSSASRGSLPVRNRQQLDAWVSYWETMRGVSPEEFMVSEYLPGRDFAFQSLWNRGHLVLAKTCERLAYLAGEWMPSGSSSTPRVGRLVNEPTVNAVCVATVRGIDSEASGIYCIDLKENGSGSPCITEVNIGRFFMISPIFNLVGRYNMAELYLQLAFGERVKIDEHDQFSDIGKEETYLVREFDGAPLIIPKSGIDNCNEA